MTLWHPDPPQGFSTEQELVIIGRPVIPRFDSPQGIKSEFIPPIETAWIDNNGNEFLDNFGEVIVFSP